MKGFGNEWLKPSGNGMGKTDLCKGFIVGEKRVFLLLH